MPIVNKRDLNNWYNSIPVQDTRPKTFSASQLKGNEIRWGIETLAKIPDIPGRISRKNVKSQYGDKVTRYVELILEKSYDKEKQQMRNKRVTIGIDVSHIFDGMMIINKKYHDYFDKEGRLIYRSSTFTQEVKAPEINKPEPEAEPMQKQDAPEARTPEQETPESTWKEETTKTSNTEKETMNGESENREEEEQDDEEIQKQIDEEKHKQDHLEFLEGMLNKYFYSIEEQAKKRPDKTVSRYQTRRINEVLKELKDFFAPTDTAYFLELAEEPTEDGEGGMTYADMEILLHAYMHTLSSYDMGRLWYK